MLVLVVGPSGAGKDTLLNAARAELAGEPRFVFPRRVVTRPAVATLEDHDSVTQAEFALQKKHGAYALSWEAHGLCYGLPRRIVDDIDAGRVVVVNGSRGMVATAMAHFPGTRIVLVTALAHIRAARLGGRGRESAADIAARLAREIEVSTPGAIVVDNSGPLAVAMAGFVSALRAL